MLFYGFRKTVRIAMGIAVLIGLAMTSQGNAQPYRGPRVQGVAQQFAQNVPQIPAAECPDRAASAAAAAEGRNAFRSRNFLAAEAAWDRAIALCSLPDRFEGRARTREARQGRLADDEERLSLLDGAIADFREAIARSHFVQGFETSAIEATIPPLEVMRGGLERRLHPHPAVTPTRPLAPVCNNTQTDNTNCGACGHACTSGQSCVSGVCQLAATGVTPLPTPNRTLARALWIGGAVVTAAGVALGVTGRLAAVARDENNALLEGPTSQRCRVVAGQTQCLGYAPGATRPDDLATMEVPGWIMTGVGVAAVVAGVVLELRGHHTSNEQRPGPTARPTVALGPDGTTTVGLTGTF